MLIFFDFLRVIKIKTIQFQRTLCKLIAVTVMVALEIAIEAYIY